MQDSLRYETTSCLVWHQDRGVCQNEWRTTVYRTAKVCVHSEARSAVHVLKHRDSRKISIRSRTWLCFGMCADVADRINDGSRTHKESPRAAVERGLGRLGGRESFGEPGFGRTSAVCCIRPEVQGQCCAHVPFEGGTKSGTCSGKPPHPLQMIEMLQLQIINASAKTAPG